MNLYDTMAGLLLTAGFMAIVWFGVTAMLRALIQSMGAGNGK